MRVFLEPVWFAGLFAWEFMVLTAAQLTIRLIMAFSIRRTVLGALMLGLVALPVAGIYDALLGPQATLSARLHWAPVPILLMGLAGFATARWLFRIRRLRGQVIAGLMVGLLDPHLFTLLSS